MKETPDSEDRHVPHIVFITRPPRVGACLGLLQKGVGVTIRLGETVRSLLCERLMISPGYVRSGISTIFLNGKPVDDIDAARLYDGDRLSLSGALPGLAGAVMRRSSVLAPLRGPASEGRAATSEAGQKGTLWLKLFNTVLDDIGPALLRQGILANPAQVVTILSEQAQDIAARSLGAFQNGEPLTLQALKKYLSSLEGLISLAVVIEPRPESDP